MRSKIVLTFLISFLIVFIAQRSSAKEAAGKYNLTIIYTNDVQGEVEPCG
jgi:2',3'-cyclic-nucleotide 2'-phosphodiesterase (5'-nucleotidase family)